MPAGPVATDAQAKGLELKNFRPVMALAAVAS
jgi:hypothetical protein